MITEWLDVADAILNVVLMLGATFCTWEWLRTKDVDAWRLAVLCLLWVIA